jgi:hypothetical protein
MRRGCAGGTDGTDGHRQGEHGCKQSRMELAREETDGGA